VRDNENRLHLKDGAHRLVAAFNDGKLEHEVIVGR
jgi:hypothetical protein